MQRAPLTLSRWIGWNSALLFFLGISIAAFVFLGNPVISPRVLWTEGENPFFADIILHARLPRVLLGAIVGGALSASGTAFQSLLRNPLADPYILGVSGGAALGGVLALAFHLPFQLVILTAFAFALGSLFVVYLIAREEGRLPPHTLLLSGVVLNAFAFALILFVNALANIGQAHQILYLLMGSLEATPLKTILWVSLLGGSGFLVLLVNSRHMNLVSLGEESATTLGLNVERHRKILFFAASLMVGACVSVAGLIGFVGLFVPHMMRLLFGADHRLLVPASALGGGIFLIVCDFLARTLFSMETFQTELPVGVVTALIGGPFFLYLLRRGRK